MKAIFLVFGLILFSLNSAALAKDNGGAEDAKLKAELQALKGNSVPVQYPKLDSPIKKNKDYNLEIGNGWRLAPEGADRTHPNIVNGEKLVYTPTLNSPQLTIEAAEALSRKRRVLIAAKRNQDFKKPEQEIQLDEDNEEFKGCNFHVSRLLYKNKRLAIGMFKTCYDTQPENIRLADAVIVPRGMGVALVNIPVEKIDKKEASENFGAYQNEIGIAKAFIPLKYFDVNFCPCKRVHALPKSEVHATVYQFKLFAGRIQRYIGRDYELLNPNFFCGEAS